jgi:hypothetical protein
MQGGDGGGVVGRVGLYLVQDRRSERVDAVGDGLDDQPQCGAGQVARVAHWGEAGHVMPSDGAVQRRLQGHQVGDVDAFLGRQRRELAQCFLRQPWRELDLRRSRRWFGAAAAHVGHEAM